jgi:two-component system, NarL family, invasion response regulator UvrY
MNSSPAQTISVLVVDASAVVRERLCALLAEQAHIRIAGEAATAAEAWTLFVERQPEAVLLDIQLPAGNGIDLLTRIKRAAPSCLVIVLTNLREAVLGEESRRRGANHFLHKATEFEQVAGLLQYRAKLADAREPSWF